MDFKEYPSYKNSGVEWLGDVPEHWDIFKSNKIFKQSNLRSRENDEQLTASQKYGVIPQSLYMKKEESRVVLALSGTGNFKHVDKNDFVISLRSFQGGIERCFYEGCVSPAYTVLKPNQVINHDFWAYLFKSTLYISALNTAVDGIREGKTISYTNFGEIYVNIPTLSEQNQIVSFLDTETARIDTLIAKQEKLIELLEEQRKSIISHAVTKGLNPNAPMKDSGVEWLGDVPSHWEVKPNKYIFKIQKLIAGKLGYDVLSITQKGLKVKDIESNAGQMAQDYSKYQIVNIGDFAMNHMDLLTGWIDVAKQRGVTSPDYRVFKLKNSNLNKQYFLNIFQMQYKQKILFAFGQGAAQMGRWRLQSEAFNKLKMPYPCIKEQVQIADFINHENLKINKLISKQQALIEKLKEYRTSIISHAVTGKIDVREFDA